jgi:cytochrome c biogenesis factor
VKARWRALGSQEGSVPLLFLTVVIFWLTMTFVSFGLYAPRNAAVIAVLFISALSVAAAVFLTLELDGPFDGLIKISSGPLRYALSQLGQ